MKNSTMLSLMSPLVNPSRSAGSGIKPLMALSIP